MSEIIERDQNFRTVGAGVDPDNLLNITMLRVDALTGELIVDVTDISLGAGSAGQIAKRDQNHRPVYLAWNEDDQELQEVLTDEEGRLLVKFI